METNSDFNDETRPKYSRWWWPVRSIWRLMVVVAASAVAMAIIATMVRHQIRPKFGIRGARIPVFQAPALVFADQVSDPFMIVADASIDPTMVVPAPVALDEAMVFSPDADGALQSMAREKESRPVPETWAPPYFSPEPR